MAKYQNEFNNYDDSKKDKAVLTLGICDDSKDFMSFIRPITGFDKVNLAYQIARLDHTFTIEVDPSLSTAKQVVNARGDLVELVAFDLVTHFQFHADLAQRLELHGFAPKLGLDSKILGPGPLIIQGRGVTSGHWRMMGDLFGHISKAQILPNAFICLPLKYMVTFIVENTFDDQEPLSS